MEYDTKRTKFFSFDRLSLFSFLWAVATLFHTISFYDDVNLFNPLSWLDALVAVILLFNSRSVPLFLLLLGFRIGHVAQWMPFTPNHILFEFVLNIGILTILLSSIFTSSRIRESGYNFQDPEVRKHLFNSFAPVARVSLFILYFYAVLHKLNWDYLNPEISCSTVLMDGMIDSRLSFLPKREWMFVGAVWGTLVLEAGIPLLLFFKRTRVVGILVGILFHYFLSIHPHGGIYSFSSLLFALFFLFTPPGFPQKLNFLLSFIVKGWQHTKLAIRGSLIVIGTGIVAFIGINWLYRPDIAGFLYWSIWAVFVGLVYTTTIVLTPQSGRRSERNIFGVQKAWHLAIPVLLIFNGMSPYLGLKTQTSFSMFSNLRTEGGKTNHIFIPNTVRLTNMQEDLVEIVETDMDWLKNLHSENQVITFFTFRRFVSKVKDDFYVKYKRNGKIQELRVQNGEINLPEAATPPSWFEEKILYFRAVDKGPCTCKH